MNCYFYATTTSNICYLKHNHLEQKRGYSAKPWLHDRKETLIMSHLMIFCKGWKENHLKVTLIITISPMQKITKGDCLSNKGYKFEQCTLPWHTSILAKTEYKGKHAWDLSDTVVLKAL